MPRVPDAQPAAARLQAKQAAMAPSSSKQDAQRAPSFWNVAVNRTKGLFNPPTRTVLGDVENVVSAPLPGGVERPRRVRRSTSSPSLKQSASTGNLRREVADHFSPPLPTLFTYRPLSPSPLKMKNKATAAPSALRRPVISSPSLPKPLDSFDFPHPKLAYPLSPMPSPVSSTFSPKTPALQSSSKLLSNQTGSDDTEADAESFNDIRLVRRRTRSAPGVKIGNHLKRPLFSPALETSQEYESALSEPSSPMIIDIASPSIASPSSADSLPSPPLETPKMSMDYFSLSSPANSAASPRSFTSVKRKPVPRHLYTEPPSHDASAPSTPMASPYPGSPLPASGAPDVARVAGAGVLHTPLLPSSELILKSCNQSWTNGRGRTLLPIGQAHAGSSTRRQHRRSVSEQGYGQMISPDGSLGLPIPWFTTNANGSMTPLITPAEEQPPFSFSNNLPAPPRLPQSPPQTPRHAQEDVSAFSDNTSVRSSVSRSGALSPLTDDEVDAIRSFLRRHATGHRERQRRKANLTREAQSRNLSTVSSEYDIHAQILESYATDEDEFFSVGESEDDADAESTVPMTASDANSMHAASVESQEPESGPSEMANEVTVASDFDAETPVIGDEVATPIDAVNRGTFGYYDIPVVRRPRSQRESTETNGYIPSDGEFETRPAIPSEWREGGTFGDEAIKSLRNKGFYVEDEDCECAEHAADATLISAPPRSSSLYYRSSSDYTPQSDLEELAYLRNSHQPLISRTMNSDSESERPISSSSASMSLSASTSTGPSTFATGIGLAIIPPKYFAHFDSLDKDEYVPPYSPTECEAEPVDDLEGSPTALGCASSPPRSRRPVDMMNGNSFDRLKTNLENLQSQPEASSQQRIIKGMKSVLRPALQINSTGIAAATAAQLPSPADTIATYPPQTFASAKGRSVQKFSTPESVHWSNAAASASADEATPGENFHSFMNLTPNDSTPKRSRVKLRQLFSRANLRAAAGRKASGEPKP